MNGVIKNGFSSLDNAGVARISDKNLSKIWIPAITAHRLCTQVKTIQNFGGNSKCGGKFEFWQEIRNLAGNSNFGAKFKLWQKIQIIDCDQEIAPSDQIIEFD